MPKPVKGESTRLRLTPKVQKIMEAIRTNNPNLLRHTGEGEAELPSAKELNQRWQNALEQLTGEQLRLVSLGREKLIDLVREAHPGEKSMFGEKSALEVLAKLGIYEDKKEEIEGEYPKTQLDEEA